MAEPGKCPKCGIGLFVWIKPEGADPVGHCISEISAAANAPGCGFTTSVSNVRLALSNTWEDYGKLKTAVKELLTKLKLGVVDGKVLTNKDELYCELSPEAAKALEEL